MNNLSGFIMSSSHIFILHNCVICSSGFVLLSWLHLFFFSIYCNKRGGEGYIVYIIIITITFGMKERAIV